MNSASSLRIQTATECVLNDIEKRLKVAADKQRQLYFWLCFQK